MATVVLQYAGAAVGTLIGGPLGGMIGRAAGAIAGNVLDQQLFGTGQKRKEGPRLNDLRVMASEEGAAIPVLWGRMRLAGQVIWASNIIEEATTATQSTSSKGAPKTSVTNYAYFANFAVGLCEGPVDGVGRVWADGKEIDVNGYTWRLYTGDEAQAPDSLIEAVEGAGATPAYRGLAYIVFERLPLADFGNRIPQFAFEVLRTANSAADKVKAINIIPGSTEFGYDTTVVQRQIATGRYEPENAHVSAERTDWSVAIDQLQGAARHLEMASLVVAWFGTDLRCGMCEIKPGVDNADKITKGSTWKVSGVARAAAHEVSVIDGTPAFGGTPSDAAVKRAIADLKARGLKVMFYPFVLMDVAQGNLLPDPYGGPAQGAYPWRGRITANLAPGRPGTPDQTAAAGAEIASFVGTATPAQFAATTDSVTYSGPAQWSYRRMILHYATLCAAAGGVDAFLIGSELRGLTTLRAAPSTYPFVAALQTLAAEVKAILPTAKISYAADWSEYFGHQPQDGTGDVHFHLDPLWASAAVDFIGIDNYMPLSDWRDGRDHLDAAAGATSIHDLAYLATGIAGGEGHDWFYASQAARDAQNRTAISDGTYGKPWVFRYKDLKSWWQQPHYNRPAGVESTLASAWVPQSKPFWFTELGCPAIDKGTNGPHVFFDAKSSESAVPPFSGGEADDLIQNRYVQAVSTYWSGTGMHNPVSAVYGAGMVDGARLFYWAWDARPYPAFPVRTDIWGDGGNFARGHWLNGRLGAVDLGELIAALCARFGVDDVDVSAVAGLVDGFLLDRPMAGRDALENLLQVFCIDAVESAGRLIFRPRTVLQSIAVARDDLVETAADKPVLTQTRAQETDLPRTVRIAYVESGLEYRSAAVMQHRLGSASAREIAIALPAAVNQSLAQARADVALEEAWAQRTSAQFTLPPSRLALEPGDVVEIEGRSLRLSSTSDGAARKIEAVHHGNDVYAPAPAAARIRAGAATPVYGEPDVVLLDLATGAPAPWIAAQAAPWPGRLAVVKQTGLSSFVFNRHVEQQATMGISLTALAAGPLARLDFNQSLDVLLSNGALASVSTAELLNGANLCCFGSAASGFELLQFQTAELVAPNSYRLGGLLRGLAGSQAEVLPSRAAGARLILLNDAVVQPAIALAEAGLATTWRIGPQQLDHGHDSYVELTLEGTLRALRPLPPVRLAGRSSASGTMLTWIRQTRSGGDSWDLAEVPLAEDAELYRVTILQGSVVKRVTDVTSPQWLYSTASMTADFGAPAAPFTARVAQVSATFGAGTSLERIINV
jgi:GTA TIM-barrel-like domain/Putative phage tail protein